RAWRPPGCSPATPPSASRPASAATSRPAWPSSSPARPPSSSPPRPCASTAASATRPTCRSSATTATRRSWSSARARTRSSAWSSPGACWPGPGRAPAEPGPSIPLLRAGPAAGAVVLVLGGGQDGPGPGRHDLVDHLPLEGDGPAPGRLEGRQQVGRPPHLLGRGPERPAGQLDLGRVDAHLPGIAERPRLPGLGEEPVVVVDVDGHH